ncbi:hypothetical protein PTTG_05170 [Puccinia triticina 1-1 BBBD Race 1]|uniref:Uncharacterized protein n=1 Tax=Puccinia triticina (isolate 1-1 / race 1 (BBBD)) TaxID=630390 RepID=A0A180H504_PUCT1|nr:hypothetical protein PTTG_05170 [Puccinia triticina 1-1 BBBD Race 1]
MASQHHITPSSAALSFGKFVNSYATQNRQILSTQYNNSFSHQKQWLYSVIESMKSKINTEFEPDNNSRTPLQKALDEDHVLRHINTYYNGARQEALSMGLIGDQIPNLYSLWVARRPKLDRGMPIIKEQNIAYCLAIHRGEIPPANNEI